MVRWDNAADVYGTLDPKNPDVPDPPRHPRRRRLRGHRRGDPEWYAVSAVTSSAGRAWETEALAALREEKKRAALLPRRLRTGRASLAAA